MFLIYVLNSSKPNTEIAMDDLNYFWITGYKQPITTVQLFLVSSRNAWMVVLLSFGSIAAKILEEKNLFHLQQYSWIKCEGRRSDNKYSYVFFWFLSFHFAFDFFSFFFEIVNSNHWHIVRHLPFFFNFHFLFRDENHENTIENKIKSNEILGWWRWCFLSDSSLPTIHVLMLNEYLLLFYLAIRK